MSDAASADTQILFYKSKDAECVAYDAESPAVAARIAQVIQSRDLDLVVEHVGSTAIPGCDGKGVIDLMLLYAPNGLAKARDVLEELGFQHQNTRDPFPEKRPMRTGAIEHRGRIYRIHVHVLAAGSDEAGELREFRDLMRTNRAAREAYIAMKRGIIVGGTVDSVDYSIAKTDFIKAMVSTTAKKS